MELVVSVETQKLIRQTLESGRYQSAREVVEDAVRVLADRDQKKSEFDAYLKREIAIGVEEIERGEGLEYSEETLHEFFGDIERRVDEELARRQYETRQPIQQ